MDNWLRVLIRTYKEAGLNNAEITLRLRDSFLPYPYPIVEIVHFVRDN